MKLLSWRRMGAIAVTSMLALTACGDDGGSGDPPAAADTSADPGGSGSGSGSTVDEGSEKTPFTFAMTTPGIGNAALLAALDAMREDGYEIETPVLADVSLAVEGLFRNEFAFSSGSTSAALLAMTQDAPTKLVGDRSGNEWALVTDTEIDACEDLDGANLAWHATNGSASVMTRHYIEETCPGTEPNYSILQGSSNRATALLAGRIDATPLELADVVSLEHSNSGEFKLLTSFAEDLPKLRPAAIYGNADFMAENPDVVVDLLTAVIEQNRKVAEDPAYLAEIAKRYLPDFDPELIDIAAPLYVELGVFDVNGGLDEESLAFTLEFFQETEEALASLTPEDIGDLSYLEEALERVGRA